MAMRAGHVWRLAKPGRPGALAVRPAEGAGGALASHRTPSGTVGHKAQSAAAAVAGRAESVAGRVFAGSSSGTAYTATTPVLGSLFGPKPPSAAVPAAAAGPKPAVSHETPLAGSTNSPKSLVELQCMPASELRGMLAVRGVSPGAACEKAELAQWVFQHQHLPAAEKPAKQAESSVQRPSSKSVAELKRMSVQELRDMLEARGVGPGSASEKGDLARWVFQHQDLPVLYKASSSSSKARRKHWRWGVGSESSEPYDSPRDETNHPKPEQIEAGDGDTRQIEGQEQLLLEGGRDPQAELSSSSRALWKITGGLLVAVASAAVALAYNDARQANEAGSGEPPDHAVPSLQTAGCARCC